MKFSKNLRSFLLPASLLLATQIQAVELKVKVENLGPEGGLYFTPLWVGFHDGSFDLYDRGAAASAGVERFAEDGDFAALRDEFAPSGGFDAVILNPEGFAGAPVFDPGLASYEVFDVDPSNQYFSYGAMILPSNDAFIANGDPMAHQIFNAAGEFTGPVSFVVYGADVLDAGTEANTESDAAFLNQMAPDTGEATADTVQLHPGFNGSAANPSATPVNILGATVPPGTAIDATAGDFTRGIYPIMRVTIQQNSTPVRVSVKNTASEGGTFFTPLWVGFHDGEFDIYDRGASASVGLERFAEDGSFDALRSDFAGFNGQDAVILNPEGFAGAPVFDPGLVSSEVFNLNPSTDRYFSYGAMLLPSNDAFFANGDPKAHALFNANGDFVGPVAFKVYGSDILDAGTEANTESDAAFFNQSAPDSGEATNDVVTTHPGYNGSVGNPDGTPQVFLGGTGGPGISFDETAADFTTAGYQVAEVRVSSLVDGGFSGSWYDPARDGHGLVIEITETDAGNQAVISWYHYAADGSGEQIWLIGTGPVVGDTAIVELIQSSGAVFGDAFNADDVTRTNWGQVRIKFNSCTTASLSYDSLVEGFGSGTETLTRLTSGPAAFNGACQL
ncbi:spondin domain-containing protein [Marinicella sp. S1101]|uniref:spondin domain-containing protein n=1 Tax=Marinicella marina TaxID=2996016 RepID=UPI00226098E8|nr:spondin domain-containing protein [Marinicella marina]MCX7553038.1 spondin domain-containing protein [Marinicella marina]MDJ1139602.1 spondin domain-containing protein [Marinicella marina]